MQLTRSLTANASSALARRSFSQALSEANLPVQMWDLLRWEGKHPQAPVSVAAKPHYFCELAVGRSVRALLAAHPAFWRSEQWRACCADGAVLELDRRHFCRVRGKGVERAETGFAARNCLCMCGAGTVRRGSLTVLCGACWC